MCEREREREREREFSVRTCSVSNEKSISSTLVGNGGYLPLATPSPKLRNNEENRVVLYNKNGAVASFSMSVTFSTSNSIYTWATSTNAFTSTLTTTATVRDPYLVSRVRGQQRVLHSGRRKLVDRCRNRFALRLCFPSTFLDILGLHHLQQSLLELTDSTHTHTRS